MTDNPIDCPWCKEKDTQLMQLRLERQQFKELAEAIGAEHLTAVLELHNALAFAASVIKSGEPWTPTCEEQIGGALSKYGV